MAVCGVKHQHVRLSLEQCACTVEHIGGYADSSAAKQSAAGISCGVGVLYALFNVLDGDESLEVAVFIDQRKLLYLVLPEYLLSLCERSADRCGDQIFLGHHFANLLVVVCDEAEVTVSEDTNEFAVFNDRNAGYLVFAHKCVCVEYTVLRRKEERIYDNAVLGTLYLVNFIDLLLDAHVLVDNTDTALSCDSDSHAAFGNGIHCRGHYRRIEHDVLGQVCPEVYHVRCNIALCRNKQYIVKCKPLFDKFLVVVAVQHRFLILTFSSSCAAADNSVELYITHCFIILELIP